MKLGHGAQKQASAVALRQNAVNLDRDNRFLLGQELGAPRYDVGRALRPPLSTAALVDHLLEDRKAAAEHPVVANADCSN